MRLVPDQLEKMAVVQVKLYVRICIVLRDWLQLHNAKQTRNIELQCVKNFDALKVKVSLKVFKINSSQNRSPTRFTNPKTKKIFCTSLKPLFFKAIKTYLYCEIFIKIKHISHQILMTITECFTFFYFITLKFL